MLEVKRGVVGGVVVVVELLVVVMAVNSQPHDVHSVSAFPCPEPESVQPCSCNYTGSVLWLACDSLGSEEELKDVFSITFPFSTYSLFRLSNSNISTLSEGTVQKLTFGTVMMHNNGMRTVESGVFSNSYSFLNSLYISEAPDDPYDWPVPDLKEFKEINSLDVSGPYGDVDPLISNSLTIARLSLFHLTTITANTFSGTPNLHTLTLEDTNLTEIAPGAFSSLASLSILKIINAHLSTVAAGTIELNATANLTSLDLHRNEIETIERDAITGVNEGTTIDLSQNLLTALDEAVFKTLLNQSAKVDVSDNPLLCGCDLVWVLDVPDEELNRLVGLLDACGLDGEYDAETIKDFFEYQCSNSTTVAQKMKYFFTITSSTMMYKIKHFFTNIFSW